MVALKDKIREIISAYKLSDRQFAIKIGVTQSVIGSMFQKGTEPSSKVIRNILAVFPEISADWFLRDSGDMLINKHDSSPDANNLRQAERIEKLIGTIETLQESIELKNQTIAMLNERIRELEHTC